MPTFPACMYICHALYLQWNTHSTLALSEEVSSNVDIELSTACPAAADRQGRQEDSLEMRAESDDEHIRTTTMNILQQQQP